MIVLSATLDSLKHPHPHTHVHNHRHTSTLTADLTSRLVDSFRWKILAGSGSFSLSDDSSPVLGLPGASAIPSTLLFSWKWGLGQVGPLELAIREAGCAVWGFVSRGKCYNLEGWPTGWSRFPNYVYVFGYARCTDCTNTFARTPFRARVAPNCGAVCTLVYGV